MFEALWEMVTGRPYRTVRSMAQEFGPPPAVVHAERLAQFTDAELMRLPRDVLLPERVRI
jgi:hypothetical protein